MYLTDEAASRWLMERRLDEEEAKAKALVNGMVDRALEKYRVETNPERTPSWHLGQAGLGALWNASLGHRQLMALAGQHPDWLYQQSASSGLMASLGLAGMFR